MTSFGASALSVGAAAPAVSPEWQLLVAESRTGRVVGRLPLAGLQWSLPLAFDSGAEFRVTVALDGPPGTDDRSVTRRLRAITDIGWRFMLVAVYGTQAIAYGYVITHKPTPTTCQIGCGDLAALLRRRIVVKPGEWQNPAAPAADTPLGPASKAAIARALFVQATAEAGAELPLDLAFPVTNDGDNVRAYLGFELGTYAERLRQLGETEDGPDITVTPVLSADQQWVRLRVDIGEPYLGQQGADWVWNLGANLEDVEPDSDSSAMAQRAYVPGDGMDQGKIIGSAYDPTLVNAGVPLLERINSGHGTVKEEPTADAYAEADVAAYQHAIESWQMRVRANATPVLGSYRRGDWVNVRLSGHWWYDNGLYRRRITHIAGDASDTVTITTAPVRGGT
jgi:hypothetical protein